MTIRDTESPSPEGGRYRIEWCRTEEIEELQGFIRAYWRADHLLGKDRAFLVWQYPERGGGEGISVLVARQDGGPMLGMLGVMPFRLCAMGEELRGAWLSMWMTAPEQRSVGLGLRLLRRALIEPYEMIGTLGGREVPLRIMEALHFDVRRSIHRWVRVISPTALRRFLGGGGERGRGDYPEELFTMWPERGGAGWRRGGVEILEWSEAAAERWERAWHGRFAPYLIGTWRDADFLARRYVRHPLFRYRVCFAARAGSGDIEALLVYRVETVRGGRGRILRIVELLGEEEAGSALVEALLEEGEQMGVAYADFFCTTDVFARPLLQAGFRHENEMPYHLPNRFQLSDPYYKPVPAAFRVDERSAKESREFFSRAAVYFTRADCDQDRPG